MLELETAVARILSLVPAPGIETVPLNHAAGRRVGSAIAARADLPPFDNSAMDGYAVRAEDVTLATRANPVRLRLAGRIEAGQSASVTVEPGTCVRLFTGSALPPGADAVVMQEDTRVEADSQAEVLVFDAVKPWENVRLRGEDMKQGELLFEPGELLNAPGIGLLAAMGESAVPVARRPVVGLLTTGSELREAGQALESGQIYESNRLAIARLIESAGALARMYPIVADRVEDTRLALRRAFDECAAVVTCGGVSVGERDYVKEAFEQLGGTLEFWKVAIKPGRPFVFGSLGTKLLFGLPGNPVSALVTCLLLVIPALRRWQGVADAALPVIPGILAEPLSNNDEKRRHFMRVTMNPNGEVRSAGLQASHRMKSTAKSNGLVDVPPRTTLPAGTPVSVLRWDTGL